ncbi:tRNA pseudouridine synthase A [Sediminitomix flava]|uniref:tRNA pseudouridine synthase A n=1 Tax=Sediminitomix flava TaxID=379075 RepID=A0A315Z920_SEDFL|nr:tRNA pseudouridine(38-40) synthase TruA [Sediminitomix flava]PWJ42055.1 tRNA pseudouridine38-40 synthase [Sediminitomix flava]
MAHRQRFYYLIEFQYLGFRYHGWQKQPNVKTIQGMVDKTINFVLEHDNFKTLGASRTDAMVSAEHSAFELFLWEKLDTKLFFEKLNKNLPNDIRAISVKETDEKFNIIQNPKTKEYLYFFSHGGKNHPFCAPYMVYMHENLDIELMKTGAKLFEGTHNFQKYCYKPSDATIFEREIIKSEIIKNDILTANFFPEESFVYKIEGKGFLRHQVRLMMGTLFKLGAGELSLDEIKESLNGGDNQALAFIAPSSGLHLHSTLFQL